MVQRGISLLLLALASAAALNACADECPRKLVTSVTYTGTRAGTLYARRLLPDGSVVGGSAGPVVAGTEGSASESCWDSAEASDERGWTLQAWVDVDGDDAERCHDVGEASCGPEADDPQGEIAFAVDGIGTTQIVLAFGD